MATIPTNKCRDCEGIGEIDGEFHVQCLGTGEVGNVALFTYFKAQADKLDAIMAEQASQRADLTAALTQIWNKVKDL